MVLDLEKYKLHREMHLSNNTKAINENTTQLHSLDIQRRKIVRSITLLIGKKV